MKEYIVNIETNNSSAGRRSHSVIYPMFSRIIPPIKISSGENIKAEQELKITIMDGKFQQASKKIGYTGQHTDLYNNFKINEVGEIIMESPLTNDRIKRNDNNPFVYGKIYSRNKYGGKLAFFRMDLETIKLQRPIKRNSKITWHNFNPSNYID